jgi:hypothetical protein
MGEAEESAPQVFRATIFYFSFAAAEQIPHLRVQFIMNADRVPVLRFGMHVAGDGVLRALGRPIFKKRAGEWHS